ncbi:MAG TPA: hypothetical protein VLA19_19345 [Herpetosiphonaceae bacterium]|nr:hypothetical protein [Herpetosiphonaceae bacterium]
MSLSSRDSRQALFDFNKLVVGAAASKLFIGPQGRDSHAILETLLPAAAACTGTVYVAFAPYPSDWEKSSPLHVDTWLLRNGRWDPL